ncbi:MAG: hypothetical protein IT513_17330 [Burkholderiales bacterium]|nr:hypothetical protein [Burkholderiales bacterium]
MIAKLGRKFTRRGRAAAFAVRERVGWHRKVRGRPGARLGVYVAYFDAAEIFDLHLSALQSNASGPFNYYVMRNCTSREEASSFDEIVARFGFPTVFRPWPEFEPHTHGESLQRMLRQTDDETILVCDVDAFPVEPGWDDYVLAELETRDAVGVLAHIPDRTGLKTYLHPCFLAVRRSFLDVHQLDVLPHGDGDPCCRVTERLIALGRFDARAVSPLLPTSHEVELFPQFRHEPAFGSANLRHGFGTTYGGRVFHLWFWRMVARRVPVRSSDGAILVTAEQMETVMRKLKTRFGVIATAAGGTAAR